MVAELDVLIRFWYEDWSVRDVEVGSEACSI